MIMKLASKLGLSNMPSVFMQLLIAVKTITTFTSCNLYLNEFSIWSTRQNATKFTDFFYLQGGFRAIYLPSPFGKKQHSKEVFLYSACLITGVKRTTNRGTKRLHSRGCYKETSFF